MSLASVGRHARIGEKRRSRRLAQPSCAAQARRCSSIARRRSCRMRTMVRFLSQQAVDFTPRICPTPICCACGPCACLAARRGVVPRALVLRDACGRWRARPTVPPDADHRERRHAPPAPANDLAHMRACHDCAYAAARQADVGTQTLVNRGACRDAARRRGTAGQRSRREVPSHGRLV
jgi:hypothetical protein